MRSTLKLLTVQEIGFSTWDFSLFAGNATGPESPVLAPPPPQDPIKSIMARIDALYAFKANENTLFGNDPAGKLYQVPLIKQVGANPIGTLPTDVGLKFPGTRVEATKLTRPQVDALLQFYGVQCFDGDLDRLHLEKVVWFLSGR